jgi:hypothetical protein
MYSVTFIAILIVGERILLLYVITRDHSPRTDSIAHTQKNGDVNLNTLLTL